MEKRYFWPLTLVIFGAIMTATLLGLLPMKMMLVWSVIMLIVGLGALLTADRDEWMVEEHKGSKHKSASEKK